MSDCDLCKRSVNPKEKVETLIRVGRGKRPAGKKRVVGHAMCIARFSLARKGVLHFDHKKLPHTYAEWEVFRRDPKGLSQESEGEGEL